jgi:hypothetical protein
MFFSQSPISSYKEPFHKKGNPQRGNCNLSFPIPQSQCKKTPDFIPQRVHAISIHNGHAEKKHFSEPNSQLAFWRSRLCLMSWSGDRERGKFQDSQTSPGSRDPLV